MPTPITAVAAHGTSVAVADTRGDLDVARRCSARRRRTAASASSAVAYAPDGTLVTGSTRRDDPRSGSRRRRPLIVHAPGAVAGDLGDRGTASSCGRRTARCASTRSTARCRRRSPARVQRRGPRAGRRGRRDRDRTRRRPLERDDREAPPPARSGTSLARDRRRVLARRPHARHRERRPRRDASGTSSSGRLLHVLRGHFFPVRTASFSPDGRWIVTASQFTAGLWDAATGQLVLYLQGNTRPLTGATFSRRATGSSPAARTARRAIVTLRHLPEPPRSRETGDRAAAQRRLSPKRLRAARAALSPCTGRPRRGRPSRRPAGAACA